jgi:alpha-L-fucosidase
MSRLHTIMPAGRREVKPPSQKVTGPWREFARGTAIGGRRLWRREDVTTTRVRLRITRAPVCPAVSEIALHREPPEAR